MQRPNRFSHKMLYEIPCHTRYSKYSHHCKRDTCALLFFPFGFQHGSLRLQQEVIRTQQAVLLTNTPIHLEVILLKKISSVYVEEKKVCSLWNKCGPLYGSQMPNALQFCDGIVSCKAVKVVIGTINVRLIQVH